MIKKDSSFGGAASVLLAAMMWSAAGLLIRGTQCSGFWLLVIRNGAAGIVLLPWLLKSRLPDIRVCLETCLFYTLFMMAFVFATRISGAAAAVAGQYTAPLVLYILMVAGKKISVHLNNVIPILLIAVGCAIGLISSRGSLLAMLFPLLCGILFPAYTHGIAKCKDGSTGAVMALCNLFCAAAALPFAMNSPLPVWRDGILIMMTGMLVNGLAYVIYGIGVKKTSQLTAVMLCLAEPVLNPVWVWLFLGEVPGKVQIISLGFILSGGLLDLFCSRWRRFDVSAGNYKK